MPPAATRGETSSRPSSPQQQDLWSQILDSVSSSRAIPSKNVLVLGEPLSGKSTVANALLQGSHGRVDPKGREKEQTTSSDFALGYEWADVRDDAEEGNIAVRPIKLALCSIGTIRYYRAAIGLHGPIIITLAPRSCSLFSPAQVCAA